ncbi:MAG: hypothetical protein WKF96_13290, partial [Solirubrobacteraceae bacterium]
MRHAILAALLGAALLAGCGGDDDGSAATTTTTKSTSAASAGAGAGTQTSTIKIVDFVYDPAAATVKAG